MVCIYCGSRTNVVNSRLQKKANRVWRRRVCQECNGIFSTQEQLVYDGSLAVQTGMSHIMPFRRDQLFLSIYDSCRHRRDSLAEATALTDTVLSKLSARAHRGLIARDDIVRAVGETLAPFDRAASVHYAAFHPLS